MIYENLKDLRTLRGISQVTPAQALGVTKQSVSNWENDNIQPSIELPVRIAQYFGVSTDYPPGLSDKTTLDVSGLSAEQIDHLRLLINDLRGGCSDRRKCRKQETT